MISAAVRSSRLVQGTAALAAALGEAARRSRALAWLREPWHVPPGSRVGRLLAGASAALEDGYGRLHRAVAAAVPGSAVLRTLAPGPPPAMGAQAGPEAPPRGPAASGWLEGSLLVAASRRLGAPAWSPFWGYALVFLTVPFVANEATLAPAALAVGWTAAWALFTGGWRPVRSPATFPLVLFAAAISVAALTSVTPAGSLRDWALNGFGIAMAFGLAGSLRGRRQVVALLAVLALAAGLTAGHAFFQFVFGAPQERAWVDPLVHPGLVRVYAGFGNPNAYSEYLLLAAPAALALVYLAPSRIVAAFWGALWLALMGALVLTYSRGAWVAMAVGMTVYAWLRDRRILAVFLLLAVLGTALAPATVLNRLASIVSLEDSSNRYRVQVWGVTLRMLSDFWATGVGLGFRAYQAVVGQYTRFLVPFHAHNLYLEFLVELGVVGFAAFVWLVVALARVALAAARRARGAPAGTVMAALASGLAAFLAHGLVEHVIYLPKIILTFWLVVGLVLAAANERAGPEGAGPEGAGP